MWPNCGRAYSGRTVKVCEKYGRVNPALDPASHTWIKRAG